MNHFLEAAMSLDMKWLNKEVDESEVVNDTVECQVNVKSQSELDIGGRETCLNLIRTHGCWSLTLSGLLVTALSTL